MGVQVISRFMKERARKYDRDFVEVDRIHDQALETKQEGEERDEEEEEEEEEEVVVIDEEEDEEDEEEEEEEDDVIIVNNLCAKQRERREKAVNLLKATLASM
jgi:hypothetical protein